jgi:ribonuclease D
MRITTCAYSRKHHSIRVENVFDTLVAAELLNEPEIGLAALVGQVPRDAVDKKFQKADWSKRPLPQPCWTTRPVIRRT